MNKHKCARICVQVPYVTSEEGKQLLTNQILMNACSVSHFSSTCIVMSQTIEKSHATAKCGSKKDMVFLN